jgi:hypothetical protein
MMMPASKSTQITASRYGRAGLVSATRRHLPAEPPSLHSLLRHG